MKFFKHILINKMKEYNITKKGLKKLKEELDYLKNEKKWEMARWLKEAAAQGDMSENAEYLEAKQEQTALENRIGELEEKIRKARIIKRRQKDIVDVGSAVEFSDSGKISKIMLVSAEEADVAGGKISSESPLGRALLGRRIGDHVEVETPKGKKKYRITKLA